MVNINSSSWIKDTSNLDAAKTANAPSVGEAASAGTAVGSSSSTTVSSLAQQLSDAATRASERESKLSWNELRDTAKATLEKVSGHSYSLNKALYDSQIPKTDDPARLARAKQATDFSNDQGTNPFAGMSRDQLDLIVYDEGGAFTTNEKFAAWAEASSQEYAWRKQFVAKSMDAYHQTGNSNGNGVAQEMLEHFLSLPQIERVQYPRSYQAQLQMLAANQATDSQGPSDLLSLLNKWEKAKQFDGLPQRDTKEDVEDQEQIAPAVTDSADPAQKLSDVPESSPKTKEM